MNSKQPLELKVNLYEHTSMQKSATYTTGKHLVKRKEQTEQPHRNIRPNGTDIAKVVSDYSFLNEIIAPVRLIDIISQPDMMSMDKNINLKTLIECATKYLSLYGIEFSFEPTGNWSNDFISLTNRFSESLPDCQELDISCSDKGFCFSVYKFSDQYWNDFVFIPVAAAQRLDKNIRKMFLQFIAIMMTENNLPYVSETFDFETMKDDIENRKDEEEDFSPEFTEVIKMYSQKNREAFLIFKEIQSYYETITTEQLYEDLSKFPYKTTEEKMQIECLQRGLQLMKDNTLLQYCCPADNNGILDDTYYDERGMWKETIMVHYGLDDDLLMDDLFNMKSDYLNQLGTFEPCIAQLLTLDRPMSKLPDANYPFLWYDYIVNDLLSVFFV